MTAISARMFCELVVTLGAFVSPAEPDVGLSDPCVEDLHVTALSVGGGGRSLMEGVNVGSPDVIRLLDNLRAAIEGSAVDEILAAYNDFE
jgi:hypothetical protein